MGLGVKFRVRVGRDRFGGIDSWIFLCMIADLAPLASDRTLPNLSCVSCIDR